MNQGEQDSTKVRRRMRGLASTMRLVADVAAARCGCVSYGERGWIDVLRLAQEEAEEASELYAEAGLTPPNGDEDEGPLDHILVVKADVRRAERSILPFWSRRSAQAQEIIRSGERERLERALGLDPPFERRYEEWRASLGVEPGDGFRVRLEQEGGWEEVEGCYYRVLRAAYERCRKEHDRLAARLGCAMAEGWEAATYGRAATMVATKPALDVARIVAPFAMRAGGTARRMRQEAEKDDL